MSTSKENADSIMEVEHTIQPPPQKPTPPSHPKKIRLPFGNPTPIGLAGFILANTPTCVCLMGWGGAGGSAGDATANVGSLFFLGTALLYFGGIGEWIIGNTFPAVIFFTFGGWWSTFGVTLVPSYKTLGAYDNPAGFYNTFAMILLFMGVLCFFYTIAAFRTNGCLVAILFSFVVTFELLAASYMCSAGGRAGAAEKLRVAGEAWGFVGSVFAWYLWFSLLLDAVDFPFALPVFDLSTHVRGKSEREMS